MDDFIQLKKDNIIRIGIKDQYGNDTGKRIEFDLEDIEMPLRYQECLEEHKKNGKFVEHQFIIIDKRQDVKGKKLLSKNEEEKLKVLNEYYKREIKALDLFLGEGKTQMILDIMGRKPYISMVDDIVEALEPVIPIIKKNHKVAIDKIKDKYKNKEDNVLE